MSNIKRDGNGRRLRMASGPLMNECMTSGTHKFGERIDCVNVGGSVAVAFDEFSPFPVVRYARATNALGTTWTRASTIVRGRFGGLGVMGSGSTSYAGHPYIVFQSNPTSGGTSPALNSPQTGIFITIAKTSDGLGDWTKPHLVTETDNATLPLGTIVVDDQYPAFHINDSTNEGFWRAGNDDGGGTWVQTATPVDGGQTFFDAVRIALIDGRPALCYRTFSNFFARFHYVRASNVLGSSWGTVHSSTGPAGTSRTAAVHLCEHNGLPHVVNGSRTPFPGENLSAPYSVLGSNADGSAWGAWTLIDGDAEGEPRPMINASDGTTINVLYALRNGAGSTATLKSATSVDGGASWSNSTLDTGIDHGDNISSNLHGLVISGQFHAAWRRDHYLVLNDNPFSNREVQISTP